MKSGKGNFEMQDASEVAKMQPTVPASSTLAANVQPGDKLKADAGFGDDIPDGAILKVRADKNKRGFNRLFVLCSRGRHYLSGNIGDHGELVGFTAA